MKALFDTNILIDYLNGVEAAAKELARYERPMISSISWIEVMVGVSDDGDEETVRGFLDTFTQVEVTKEIAEVSVRLRKEHGLKIPDALIYASARENACLLITRNTKDFKPDWVDVRVPY